MAQKRTGSKRCAVAVAALLFLISCTPEQYGFSGDAAEGTLAVPARAHSLSLQIALDDGYAAAQTFTQRVTLRVGEKETQLERADLSAPFVFPLTGPIETGTLDLVIGFCDVRTKEICFVATDTLTLVATQPEAGQSPAAGNLTVSYRPQPPQQ